MGSYVVQSGSRHCFSNARLGNAIKDIGILLSAYLPFPSLPVLL